MTSAGWSAVSDWLQKARILGWGEEGSEWTSYCDYPIWGILQTRNDASCPIWWSFNAVQRCGQGNTMSIVGTQEAKPSVYSIRQFFAGKRWPSHMIIIISPSSWRQTRTLSVSLIFQFGVIGCCYDELKKMPDFCASVRRRWTVISAPSTYFGWAHYNSWLPTGRWSESICVQFQPSLSLSSIRRFTILLIKQRIAWVMEVCCGRLG